MRTVWVENWGLECHFGGKVRVFGGEGEVGAVESSCCVYLSLAMLAKGVEWWENGLYRHNICSHRIS